MKCGRPKLYKVIEFSKREWLLYHYDTNNKSYHLVNRFKNELLANDEMEHRYESRRLNKNFAKRIIQFNVRNSNISKNS